MAKAPKQESSSSPPTAPQPRDAQGFVLDAWGLPLSGPARVVRLAELGKPDPRETPDAWTVQGADKAAATPVHSETQEG